MSGFGAVEIERNEPAFHERWEARAFALNNLGLRVLGAYNVHEYRHAVERMDPAHYLAASYYERWFTGVATLLVEKGVVTREELEARAGGPVPALAAAADVGADGRASRRPTARFARGDRVRVRDIHPARPHARAPLRARQARRACCASRPRSRFPTSRVTRCRAHREHTYHVEFDARELWTDAAGGGETRGRRSLGELPGGGVMSDPRQSEPPAPDRRARARARGGAGGEAARARGLPREAPRDAGEENSTRRTARASSRARGSIPAYRARLLADGSAASAELGFRAAEQRIPRRAREHADVHNVIVCTQCSCTAWSVLGLPPDWYKSPAYRARVVREPRAAAARDGSRPARGRRDPRLGHERRDALHGAARFGRRGPRAGARRGSPRS